MANDTVAPTVGAVASLLLALVVFAPALLISGSNASVADYYAAGPVGISVVGFFALLGIIIFLAGAQERTEPAIVAGLTLVLGVAMLAFAVIWAFSLDQTLLFSFPSQYAWIANHRWAVIGLTAVVPVAAGVYSRRVLS
ncbi:hypothetical protein GL213_10960 [Halogeometricum borinquense]|uniref:Uncharacterized protein n=1 Tax=Halogeometricum borinquense TaxID=60847 RepID=A0A6C0UII8_9EURY|nr:hypothetical protein [Halogeometricum borinquense]QIB73649.1 hypothetical protein G3I44_04730 [Halogeometricum borinquense]QIQ76995.1 hypothetical protein GL213_10960 [Halogeometricum borinquense]